MVDVERSRPASSRRRGRRRAARAGRGDVLAIRRRAAPVHRRPTVPVLRGEGRGVMAPRRQSTSAHAPARPAGAAARPAGRDRRPPDRRGRRARRRRSGATRTPGSRRSTSSSSARRRTRSGRGPSRTAPTTSSPTPRRPTSTTRAGSALAPADTMRRLANGRVCFNWYRIAVTLPERDRRHST